ncbi:hypothetical protein [Fodinicola feengrottensis]|uniref:hypothetical protein n=1 Tax=Fodinicola feengrottensis TaxID=435914 RepID=UPI0024414370|nr:hypothetical protein [Fodinicola feengrottensis]
MERVCDHVVVLDGGKLLRSSAVGDLTRATRTVVVELVEGADLLARALDSAGLRTQLDGHLVAVDVEDDSAYDTVRDTVVELDLALVRLQQRRHRIEEVFRAEEASVV